MKIYIINPKYDIPSYFGSDILTKLSGSPTIQIADLCLPTLAAYIPSDIEIELCDENLSEINFNNQAVIFITGKDEQTIRIKEIAKEFKKRNQTVVIGGVTATLSDELNKYCDTIVRGEFESVAEEFFQDLKDNKLKTEYKAIFNNLQRTKTPRWDLYPCEKTLMGSLQITRGCNYFCDFCQVAIYLGKQRHKPIPSILKELDLLYSRGFRYVFICDDNFTADIEYSKQVLKAIAEWNNREFMCFMAQLPLNISKNKELLDLLGKAGVISAFVGVETINKNTLLNQHKTQNIDINIKSAMRAFLKAGILVIGSIMFGFEEDTPEEAKKLKNYLSNLPIPIYTICGVVAKKGTKLYSKLSETNSVLDKQIVNSSLDSNIKWKNMTNIEFQRSIVDLIEGLYENAVFYNRISHTLKILKINPKLSKYKDKLISERLDSKFLKELKSENLNLYKMLISWCYTEKYLHLISIIMLYLQIKHTIKVLNKI